MNRAACDSMFGFGGNVTLVSYVPQTKQKKNVVLFSSMHHDDKIDPESSDMKKPEIISDMKKPEIRPRVEWIWLTKWQGSTTLQEIVDVGL